MLEEVAPTTGAVVQHLGSWLLLGGLNDLGFYDVAARHKGSELETTSLRVAIDATAISLAVGEASVEGVRRLDTPSVDTLATPRRVFGELGAASVSRLR
jgi:hypothetical protein